MSKSVTYVSGTSVTLDSGLNTPARERVGAFINERARTGAAIPWAGLID